MSITPRARAPATLWGRSRVEHTATVRGAFLLSLIHIWAARPPEGGRTSQNCRAAPFPWPCPGKRGGFSRAAAPGAYSCLLYTSCLFGEKTENTLTPGTHGSTFGGSPAVCAGALSILGRIDEALLAQVRAKSEYLFSAFEGRPGVEQVSGLGLMIGIRTAKPAAEVVAKCMEQGVLVLTAHGKVRLLPALNIPMELVKKAAEVIIAACA